MNGIRRIGWRAIVGVLVGVCLHLPVQMASGQNLGVRAWGANNIGQLGDGTYTNSNTPLQIKSLLEVTAVAGGFYHTLALKQDGTVWTWGFNYYGQLGDGTFDTTSPYDKNIPIQVLNLSDVKAIAGGWEHNLALRQDGTVWTWGYNGDGELGDGTFDTLPPFGKSIPVQVKHLSDVKAIAGGGHHSLALKQDGTVWTWGYNLWGQLGNGTHTNSNTPVQVKNLSEVIAIAGSIDHSLALRQDGTVWAWGVNAAGQLGDGTFDIVPPFGKSIPVQVRNLSDVKAIAGGGDHSLALKQDGTVWTWGGNDLGQLGDGTYNTYPSYGKHTPVQVKNLSGVTAVAGGSTHSLALKQDGTVWAWGDNYEGQLGDGTYSDPPYFKHTPVQVKNLSGAIALAGGGHHSLALTPPYASLSGNLTFLHRIPTAESLDVSFIFRDTSGSETTYIQSVPTEGAFALDVLPGTYTLHIKAIPYLATNVAVDLSGGNVSGVTASLIPGDANDDNSIDIFDLATLAEAFNSQPGSVNWNPNADFNGNSEISIFDLAILAEFFNTNGDP